MKKIIVIGIAAISILLCSGFIGNKYKFDTVYTFNRALVKWPDGTMKEIKIKKWRDYEDGEQLQITGEDGKVYMVSPFNTVLIQD